VAEGDCSVQEVQRGLEKAAVSFPFNFGGGGGGGGAEEHCLNMIPLRPVLNLFGGRQRGIPPLA
jgi:hypothetical protein